MEDEENMLYGEDEGGGEPEDSQDVDTNAPQEEAIQEEEQSQEPPSQQAEDEEGSDDDSDDDNVQIVIDQGKIDEAKTSIGQGFGIKPTSRAPPSERKGRFNVEDFDQVGTIDGAAAHEVDLENIEDKPWRKPGADITDYFNYGFTEETWAAYCARQKRMRVGESGVGMPGNPNQNPVSNSHQNFNSKSHNGGTIPILGNQLKRPPPIQSSSSDSHSANSNAPTSSGISVLTADKRGYSRKIFDNVDFSVPPPGMNVPPPSLPSHNFSAPPPTSDEFNAFEDENIYEGGYEPTQESQWVAPPSAYLGDRPANADAPPGDAAFDDKRDPWQRSNNGRRVSREADFRDDRKRRRSRSRSRERYDRYRDRDRERDRDRDRDRERDRDRDRDRGERSSRRRSRSRDRSNRRSRSRSPRDSRSPSHKHKKSKREKRDRSEKPDREIKKEIKEEPQEYAE